MPNVRRKAAARKPILTSADLFSPHPVLVQAATRAARKLAARYGLSLAHASTIANLAGLGVNRDER